VIANGHYNTHKMVGFEPTTLGSAVRRSNTTANQEPTSSLVRFENKNIFYCVEKNRSSLLQRWRKVLSRKIGSRVSIRFSINKLFVRGS
jgi:hypothetical protein